MRDIAAIAADLRRVVPVEHWGLVDEVVNYSINEILRGFQADLREAQRERYTETLPAER